MQYNNEDVVIPTKDPWFIELFFCLFGICCWILIGGLIYFIAQLF